ncbi:LRR 1 domain containing protein [Trichuris trichiura]|uniref:LRR 1 domain containing protein n=1 Tax=Trichuris trichiura TaxID=36087 RepID=A0A077Z986_TRITR|nr:LRR 1 domain containing protein [Trichuris trichiura]
MSGQLNERPSKQTDVDNCNGVVQAICHGKKAISLSIGDIDRKVPNKKDEKQNGLVDKVCFQQAKREGGLIRSQPMQERCNDTPELPASNSVYPVCYFFFIRSLVISGYKFPDGKVCVDLSGLTSLKRLHMENCGIVEFEKDFCKLLPSSIKAVNLSGNKLTCFPDFVCKLPLRSLTISDNPITWVTHRYPLFVQHLRLLYMERLCLEVLPHWTLNLCLSMASFKGTCFSLPENFQMLRLPKQATNVKRLEELCFVTLLRMVENPMKIPSKLIYHYYVCCKCRQAVFESNAIVVNLWVPIGAIARRWKMGEGFPMKDQIACHAVFCSMHCALMYQDALKKCYCSMYHYPATYTSP